MVRKNFHMLSSGLVEVLKQETDKLRGNRAISAGDDENSTRGLANTGRM